MTIELIAIDLDGTLLTNEKKNQLKGKKITLAKAKEKRNQSRYCTGRPFTGV